MNSNSNNFSFLFSVHFNPFFPRIIIMKKAPISFLKETSIPITNTDAHSKQHAFDYCISVGRTKCTKFFDTMKFFVGYVKPVQKYSISCVSMDSHITCSYQLIYSFTVDIPFRKSLCTK